LIGAESPSRVVFTLNGTDSLNLAIQGVLRPKDHVVTSVVEHNSVLRPLRYLEQSRGIRVTRVGCDSAGVVDAEAIRAAIQADTRLICLSHGSNVTGALQPVEAVGRIAADSDVLFLVDAAQSLGYVPINVKHMGCQFLAAPGHKGLLGPLGTGVLYLAPGIEESVNPLRVGGTGTQSHEDVQPLTMPDKFEAGNLNVPGIVGLAAGIEYLLNRGMEEIQDCHQRLAGRLIEGLQDIDGVHFFGPMQRKDRLGVVSITAVDFDPREVASMLDTSYRIQVRAGLHCAPLMHQALGTALQSGTIRFSIGHFNTAEQIDAAIQAMQEIAAASIEA
jgi:cysteine desulfurase family protein